MSIHIIYGPGGAGKSLYQTNLILDELAHGKRNVLTNLPLNVGRVVEFLGEKYPHVSGMRIVERLRILTEKESRRFWEHRGPLLWSSGVNSANGYADLVTLEASSPFGVFYVIDEAGLCGFSALAWGEDKERSLRCLDYLDQQRKRGDDSYFSTNGRAPNAIAKGFRDKAHFFIRLKNNRLAVFGPFRGRDNFRQEMFIIEPTPSNGAEPVSQTTFKLDIKGAASCYRTADGVGVAGGIADVGRVAKGWSIMWVFPLFLGVSSLCVLIPWGLGKATQTVLGSKTQAAVAAAVAPVGVRPGVVPGVVPGAAVSPAPVPLAAAAVVSDQVFATGWAAIGGRVLVTLSNGQTLSGAAKDFHLGRSSVSDRLGRRVYQFRTLRTPGVPAGVPLPLPLRQIASNETGGGSGGPPGEAVGGGSGWAAGGGGARSAPPAAAH